MTSMSTAAHVAVAAARGAAPRDRSMSLADGMTQASVRPPSSVDSATDAGSPATGREATTGSLMDIAVGCVDMASTRDLGRAGLKLGRRSVATRVVDDLVGEGECRTGAGHVGGN